MPISDGAKLDLIRRVCLQAQQYWSSASIQRTMQLISVIAGADKLDFYRTSTHTSLVQGLRKNPELFADLLPFLREDVGSCTTCGFSYFDHRREEKQDKVCCSFTAPPLKVSRPRRQR